MVCGDESLGSEPHYHTTAGAIIYIPWHRREIEGVLITVNEPETALY